ncbi:hypothetical protein [Phascolarctobacterium faecium]|uniref:hypothetical protein n=1 Tax=Phascolarctobacterium faecium TaxID=33025 RepID=UPI003AB30F6B
MINDGTVKWETRKITEAEISRNSSLLNGKTVEEIENDFENDFLKNIKVNGVMVVIGNFTASRQGTSETLYGQIPLPVDYIRSQCKYWTPVIAYDSGNSNPREINWTSINQTDGSVSLYSKRSASNNVTMNYLLFAVK